MRAGTILVVEPNPGVLIVARNVLSRAGHHVVAVATAEDAAKQAERLDLDAVVMDARQAEPTLLSSFRIRRSIPVILTFQRGKPVSDGADVDETQPGVGAADYLEKPFVPERLLTTVQRALEGSAERAAFERGDTLVSQPTDGMEESPDTEQTDIFPFARLLEYGRTSPPVRSRGVARDVRAGHLAEHLRTYLEVERIPVRPGLLSACLRACDAVLELADQVHAIPPEGDPAPAIEGVIPQLSIDQVLQLAMAVGQPSRCRVAQDSAVIDVYYDQGNIAFARQSGLPDGFLLGRILLSMGRVTEDELNGALHAPRDGTRIGQRLRSWGGLSDTDLGAALRLQTEELVYEVVRWSTGRFAIFADEALPPEARAAKLTLAVPHLLLEGMRRLDEWRRMKPQIGDLDSVLERREPPASDALPDLTTEDRELLQYVDGRRTIAELVSGVARPTFHVYRSLQSLADRQLVIVVPTL